MLETADVGFRKGFEGVLGEAWIIALMIMNA